MSRIGLTREQHKLALYIQDFVAENDGVAPSYTDMQAHMGLASRSGINRLICSLEERGWLRRIPHRARAIELLHQIPTLREDVWKVAKAALERIGAAPSEDNIARVSTALRACNPTPSV